MPEIKIDHYELRINLVAIEGKPEDGGNFSYVQDTAALWIAGNAKKDLEDFLNSLKSLREVNSETLLNLCRKWSRDCKM